jgi:hypothetical protein
MSRAVVILWINTELGKFEENYFGGCDGNEAKF